MTLSIGGHIDGVSRRVTGLPASAAIRTRRNDPWASQMEGRTADLKRRIPLMRQLTAECDGMAAKLDQEVRTEEDRVKEDDPAAITYSPYAKATASRRDNLRRSAEELRAHLVKAEKALRELGEDS
jgi:hypothetical protein